MLDCSIFIAAILLCVLLPVNAIPGLSPGLCLRIFIVCRSREKLYVNRPYPRDFITRSPLFLFRDHLLSRFFFLIISFHSVLVGRVFGFVFCM